jgi:hypothetical protein
MGQDPRETPVSALLTRSQVRALQKLRDAQIPKTYRDPTLDSYTALLVDVSVNWDSRKLHFYQCSLTFRRQGVQAQAEPPIILQSAYESAAGQYDALLDTLGADGLAGTPDWTSGVANSPSTAQATEAATTWGSNWDVFSEAAMQQLDIGPDPSIGKNELASLGSALIESGNDLVGLVEKVAQETTGLIAGTVDLAYSIRGQMATLNAFVGDVVDAASSEPVGWVREMITEPVDIAVFVQRKLGVVSEAIVAAVMEANTSGYMLDPFSVPAGVEISIPANLDEFS